MEQTTVKRVIKSSFLGLISFILSFLQSLLLIPFLLRYWGEGSYSYWVLIMAAYAIFQILDTGHTAYIGNKINLEYHTDRLKAKESLSSSIMIAVILGLIQIAMVVLLIVTHNLSYPLGIAEDKIAQNNIHWGFLSLIISWWLCGSIGGILVRLLIPLNYFNETQVWGIITRFLQFVSLLAIGYFNLSIINACLLYSVQTCIINFFLFLRIKKITKEFYPWWGGFSLKIGFQNLLKSFTFTFNSLGQQLTLNGSIILISHIASSTVSLTFSTMRTLTNSINAGTTILTNSIYPEITRLYAIKDNKNILLLFRAYSFASSFIINIGIIAILPFAETIYNQWTHHKLHFDFLLLFSLVIAVALSAISALYYQIIVSTNQLKTLRYITLIRIITVFPLIYLFHQIWNVAGIGIAILISELICSSLIPFIFCINHFSIKITKNLFLVFNLLNTLLLAVCVWLFNYYSFNLFYLYLILPLLVFYYFPEFSKTKKLLNF